MNKKIIWGIVLLVALVGAGAIWQMKASQPDDVADQSKQSKPSDAAKFRQEYTKVAADNRYVYATAAEVLSIFEEGDGLVFLGFPECPWCQQLAPIVDEAAKAEGLEQIHYLNIRAAREANDETYQKLVAKLGEHLDKDEDGQPRIYVPDVTALSGGEVVGHFKQESSDEGEQSTPDTYWTDERRERAITQLRGMMSKIKFAFETVQDAVSHGATLLDVRTSQEYLAGHFDGAVNLDINDIQRGQRPDADKDSLIYLYCRSGNRSEAAKLALESAGYTRVVDLGGLPDVQAIGGKLKT